MLDPLATLALAHGRGVIFKGRNIKLAFTCLLTAVGVPMILAGDEFADERDIAIAEPTGRNKQIDPVNYDRFSDPWRQDLFAFVSRLARRRPIPLGIARMSNEAGAKPRRRSVVAISREEH